MAGPADEEEEGRRHLLLVNAARDVASSDTSVALQQAAPTVLAGAQASTPQTHRRRRAPGLDKEPQAAPENTGSLSLTTEPHGLYAGRAKTSSSRRQPLPRPGRPPPGGIDELASCENAPDINPMSARPFSTPATRALPADSLEHALNRLDYQEIMLTSDPH